MCLHSLARMKLEDNFQELVLLWSGNSGAELRLSGFVSSLYLLSHLAELDIFYYKITSEILASCYYYY